MMGTISLRIKVKNIITNFLRAMKDKQFLQGNYQLLQHTSEEDQCRDKLIFCFHVLK